MLLVLFRTTLLYRCVVYLTSADRLYTLELIGTFLVCKFFKAFGDGA